MSTEDNHRIYKYLVARVEYPQERGYRMEPRQLPDWIHLEVTTRNGSKYLTVHSRIHMNKCVQVGPSYSLAFSDRDIVQDLSGEITHRFKV